MKPSLALLTAAVLAAADLHGADADKRAHAPTALPAAATSARSQALAKPHGARLAASKVSSE